MHTKPVVLITGASRGIGAKTARCFAEHGYSVCVNYATHHEAANQVANTITKQGGQCQTLQADIASEQGVLRLFNAIDQIFGRLDVLVNNAGILEQQCTVEALNEKRINRILQTNVTGAFLCCREAVKRMAVDNGGDGGVIINVSSRAAITGSPYEYVDYAASKAALDALTKGLSIEVADRGIRVNGVRPGLIHTDMHADGGEANRVERLKNRIPMRRGGQPEEVSEAILWLASNKASFVTGAMLDVSGGL